MCYRRWMWSRAPLRRHVRWSETSGKGIAAKHIRSSRGAAALKLRYAKPAARTRFLLARRPAGLSWSESGFKHLARCDLFMKISASCVNQFSVYGYWVTATRLLRKLQSSLPLTKMCAKWKKKSAHTKNNFNTSKVRSVLIKMPFAYLF
jgi:hypothetical protein